MGLAARDVAAHREYNAPAARPPVTSPAGIGMSGTDAACAYGVWLQPAEQRISRRKRGIVVRRSFQVVTLAATPMVPMAQAVATATPTPTHSSSRDSF